MLRTKHMIANTHKRTKQLIEVQDNNEKAKKFTIIAISFSNGQVTTPQNTKIRQVINAFHCTLKLFAL